MAMQLLSDDDDALWAKLEAGADELAGAAAEAHLRAGRAIYYSEPGTPEGLMIREMPDGQKCLVRIVIAGNEVHETVV